MKRVTPSRSRRSCIRLTSGRARSLHPDTLAKWLNAQEEEHAPSLLAVFVFCLATGRQDPFRVCLSALGDNVEIMTEEDRVFRDYGRAVMEREDAAEKAKDVKKRIKEARQ